MCQVRQLKQHIQDLSSQLAASQEAVSVLPPHEASLDSGEAQIPFMRWDRWPFMDAYLLTMDS